MALPSGAGPGTLTSQARATRLDADRTLAGAAGTPPRVIAAADAVSANLTLAVPIVHPQRWAAWSHATDAIDVVTATRDYSPYVTGVFQPFCQNPASLTQPLTGWQVQLVLTLPLYDGGLRYGQKMERDALRDEAKLALERRCARPCATCGRPSRRCKRGTRPSAPRVRRRLSPPRLSSSRPSPTKRARRRTSRSSTPSVARATQPHKAVVAEDAARQARLDLLAATGRFP